MNRKEQEARELVIAACKRLVETGLVARTWGNISARVSTDHFVITPSGRAYETLQSDQLVLVRIDDCSYEGDIKPSSEKGIHAAAYLHRPDAGVVIHTHQDYASCVGVGGKDLSDLDDPVLGSFVPCAAYGLPGTKKLLGHVDSVMIKHNNCNAMFMHRHGVLCMARDFERAFEMLQALEDVSRRAFESAVTLPERKATDGNTLLSELRKAGVAPHLSIESHPAVLAVAAQGKTLRPHLDDLAQIAGATVRCVKNDPVAIQKGLRRRNAVLVDGIGAICCAEDESDLGAIEAIIRKGCMAALYAESCGATSLSGIDRRLMRFVYTTKYSRKKSEA